MAAESNASHFKQDPPKTCGVVMPISSIDGCLETHWADVLAIHTEAIEAAGFTANIVSNADDVAIIHKNIIQNLYTNPIVVCDVSGKNPNVMFELGMRLAFDKPVVIVKDDKTAYSFDTSLIEHLTYPRDLRFGKIVEFKENLRFKIEKTAAKAEKTENYSPFLGQIGDFKVAKLDTKVVSADELIMDQLKVLTKSVSHLVNAREDAQGWSATGRKITRKESKHFILAINPDDCEDLDSLIDDLKCYQNVLRVIKHKSDRGTIILEIITNDAANKIELELTLDVHGLYKVSSLVEVMP